MIEKIKYQEQGLAPGSIVILCGFPKTEKTTAALSFPKPLGPDLERLRGIFLSEMRDAEPYKGIRDRKRRGMSGRMNTNGDPEGVVYQSASGSSVLQFKSLARMGVAMTIIKVKLKGEKRRNNVPPLLL